MMREPLIYTAAILAMAWATSGKADGIAESLTPVDPCWQAAFAADGMQDFAAIVEQDVGAQAALYSINCGWTVKPPMTPELIAFAFGKYQPEPLPSPA